MLPLISRPEAANIGTILSTARWPSSQTRRTSCVALIGLSALAISALPTLALADGDGALTGAAGGAVTARSSADRVAVVGGVAGAAIGGATSTGAGRCRPRRRPVQHADHNHTE